MILDANLIFAGSVATGVPVGQTVTGAGGIPAANIIDLGLAGRDIGKGEPLDVSITVTESAAGGSSMRFVVIQADDPSMSGGQMIQQSDDIPPNWLVRGAVVNMRLARADPYPAKRFLFLRFVANGTFTAGAYFACIVEGAADKQVNTPAGFQIA